MFAEWAIASALRPAKPQPPAGKYYFQPLTLPAPWRWRSFLASLALHAACLTLLPALSEFISAVSPAGWIRRARLIPPVEIRVPEQLYLATPGPRRPPARLKKAIARARLLPRAATRPAAGLKAGQPLAHARPLRRFELPPLPARKSPLTLLQPEFPPDLPVLGDVRLPQFFFWAPLPMTPAARIRKPFILPGHAEPFAQVPRMDAPPQLEAPNWETLTAMLRIASAFKGRPDSLLVPATSMPVRMLQPDALPPPQTHVAVDRSLGDPSAILALTSRPKPLREELLVPPGNQLGELPDGFGTAERAGGPGPAAAASDPGGKTAPIPAPAASTAADTATPPSAPGDRIETAVAPPAVPPPLTESAATPPAISPPLVGGNATPVAPPPPLAESAATPGKANPAGEAATPVANRAEPVMAPLPSLPAGTIRTVHPVDGVFDVVVVHPSPADGLLESSGALSGRPVYSVYLQVGAPREWIMQYCVPGEDNQTASVTGSVVRLGNPAPLIAPYPRVTYLPVIQPRPGVHLMIHGFLDPAGRFRNLEVLRTADQEEGRSVLPVLDRWEFRPALRDGIPVRVEILLAIPLIR